MGPLVVRPDISQTMIPEVRAFRDSLRAEEQEAFDNLCQAASENYRMMDRVGLVIPLEKILFAVLIEQQKQIEHLKQVLDTNKVIPGSLNGS